MKVWYFVRGVLICVLAVPLSGCGAHYQTMLYGRAPLPEIEEDDVKVYKTLEQLPKPYNLLGKVTVRSDEIEDAVEIAAEVGANAAVGPYVTEGGYGVHPHVTVLAAKAPAGAPDTGTRPAFIVSILPAIKLADRTKLGEETATEAEEFMGKFMQTALTLNGYYVKRVNRNVGRIAIDTVEAMDRKTFEKIFGKDSDLLMVIEAEGYDETGTTALLSKKEFALKGGLFRVSDGSKVIELRSERAVWGGFLKGFLGGGIVGGALHAAEHSGLPLGEAYIGITDIAGRMPKIQGAKIYTRL